MPRRTVYIFLLLALSLLIALDSCAPNAVYISNSPETPSAPSVPSESIASVPAEPPEEIPVAGPDRLTLVVTGDIMAHEEQLIDAYDAESKTYDFSHCFEQVEADLMQGFAIGNLETVFGGEEIGYSSYPQFNTPDAYGVALKESGFDFLTTCNNHSLDKYEPGLLRTLDKLDEIGLLHTGTYASREEQDKITIVEEQGFKIAILAFTFSTNGIPTPRDKDYLVNMLTEQRLIDDLAKARAQSPDLIIVMPHMGNEYEDTARDVFINWMDLALYHGADMVFASHPHVLQQMMVRELTDIDGRERQGFIICSLGNFISSQRYEPREASIILKLEVSREEMQKPVIEQVSFVPVWVQYRDTAGQYLIRVLPIGDAIVSLSEDENPLALRPGDIARLYRAHTEITARYLGSGVPREEMQREYIFYQRPPGG